METEQDDDDNDVKGKKVADPEPKKVASSWVETHMPLPTTTTPPLPLQQRRRLSIVIDSIGDMRELSRRPPPALAWFDQVTGVLGSSSSDETLMAMATCPLFDALTLNMCDRLPFFLRFQTVGAAIDREAVFEVPVSSLSAHASPDSDSPLSSPAIANTITTARSLWRHSRGKGLCLVSYASSSQALLSPLVLANYGLLFGWSSVSQGLDWISSSRYHFSPGRTYASVLSIFPLPPSTDNDPLPSSSDP